MRKSLIIYSFAFVLCQFALVGILHLASFMHSVGFAVYLHDEPLPPMTILTLVLPPWLYLLPAGFLILSVIAVRKEASDRTFLRIIASLVITSLVVSVVIVFGLSLPMLVVINQLAAS